MKTSTVPFKGKEKDSIDPRPTLKWFLNKKRKKRMKLIMRWLIGLSKRLNHPLRCSMKASTGLSHSKTPWRSFVYWKACAQNCLFGFQMMKQDSQLKSHIKSQTTLPWFLTSVKTQWAPMMWTKRSSFERLRKIILRAWWLSWIPSSFQRSWMKGHGQIM